MLEICGLKIVVNSGVKKFGYDCKFCSGFNVIRADNSQGKSTLISAILYGLGFEEILGGKNEFALPHALCVSVLESDSASGNEITSSEVWIEYKNGTDIKTNRRSIVDPSKNSKLIEVYNGALLSNPDGHYVKKDYYVHDKNSAQSIDAGYFAYLESFCDLNLPEITAPDGRASKLYIQYIAAASLIEQRLGWTSYIANLPYFGIKDAKQKTIEFILGLSSINRDAERRRVQSDFTKLQEQWFEIITTIKNGFQNDSLAVQGLSRVIDFTFTRNAVAVVKPSPEGPIEVNSYLDSLREELTNIEEKQLLHNSGSSISEPNEIDTLISQQMALTDTERRLAFTQRTLIAENEKLNKSLNEVEEDLTRNKAAKKIRELGGEYDLHTSHSHCPICTQEISEDIDLLTRNFHTMSLDQNINYIESQRKLIKSSISANTISLNDLSPRMREIRTRINDISNRLNRIRREIAFKEGVVSESTLYRKIKIENEIDSIAKAIGNQLNLFPDLEKLSKRGEMLSAKLKSLQPGKTPEGDASIIRQFSFELRRLLKFFKFSSFSSDLVALDDEKITPIIKYNEMQSDISGDNISGISAIATGSTTSKTEKAASASDFTRLIWAFTLALRSCASKLNSTHLGLVIMDEPQQHSMNSESMRALFKTCALSAEQSIIAASFDCSEANYIEITTGIDFNLVKFEGKLLKLIE